MESIASRIVFLIDSKYGGNKSAFARAMNITPAYAAQLYAGQRAPSDRTIADICRIYGIQEDWLRYGLEPMRAEKSEEEQIAELVGSALNGSSRLKKAVVKMICSRSDAELQALEDMLRNLYEDISK